jgi:lysozyme
MRPIPFEAPEFIRAHEGCVLRVYDDAKPRVILKPTTTIDGTLTAGYGHTSPDLKVGMHVTLEMADAWLMSDLGIAAQRLWDRIGAVIEELTEFQYAALLSFVFNLGADPKWTIWKRLKARQFDQVPAEMMKFVNAGGRKLQGLVNRRAAEVALFTTAEPGIGHETLPSSATRLMDTTPTPADPVAPKKSATIWAAITAPVMAFLAWLGDLLSKVPDFANTALNAINPFAQKSELAQIIANGVGGLAAVAGLYVAWSVVKKKNESRR